jgi:serine/threonine protein kinase
MNRAEENHNRIEQDNSGKLMKIHCHSCRQKLDVSSLAPFERIECPKCGMEIIVPMWFEHYLFEEHIGEGKFANVYRALDLTLDREAAVKVLKPEHEKKYGKLFLKAARNAARLNHFSITPIYSCGKFQKQSYFVSKYISEGTLADVLRNNGPQPIEKVIPWMIEITEGLHYASKQGMVHHAVTLDHMPLVEEQSKISDFSASFFEGESPELSLNSQNEDNLDIFNLGVAFYQLLTGSSPSEGGAETHNIPDKIQALILKMLTEGVVNRISYSEIISVLKGGELSEAEVAPESKHSSHPILKKWCIRLSVTVVLVIIVIFVILYSKSKNEIAKLNYLTSDHVPKSTQAINNNNLTKANRMAELVMIDGKSSQTAKKEAAILMILACGLNNDRKLNEKCDYVGKILKTAEIPDNDKIYILIDYPASLKMPPGQLLEVMNYSPNSTALAHFMIVMRYLYYGCKRETILQALGKLETAMNRCSRGSWVYQVLYDRASTYRALISKEGIITNPYSDPVLKSFITQLEKAEKKQEEDKKK